MTPSREKACFRPRLFYVLFVLVLLASACSFSPEPTPVASGPLTGVPTDTALPGSTPTETPPPGPTNTPTVRPTRAPTPLPGWVAEFAEPALQAVAGRAPTYQDDFSDPSSGWYNGQTEYGLAQIAGEKGYVDGEYRTLAGGNPPTGETICSGVEDQNVGIYGDFVAEFDVRFFSGGGGDLQFQFHRWTNPAEGTYGQYVLLLNRSEGVFFTECAWNNQGCTGLASRGDGTIATGADWNHFQLIVRGTTMAAYLNGIPYLYYDDRTAPPDARAGYFSLAVCNFGTSPFEARWDNFRLWDISDLP